MPAAFTVYSATKSFVGPKELPYQYPTNIFNDEMFVLRDESGCPIKNFSYKMTLDNGDIYYGKTNAKGETQRISTGARVGSIKVMPDDRG